MKKKEQPVQTLNRQKGKFDSLMEMFEINVYRAILYGILIGLVALGVWFVIELYKNGLVNQ